MKVLVVDNDQIVLRFMTEILTKEGHEVITAKDGLFAMDILEDYTPDVIFIDLIMPNISGKTLCKIIRRTEKLKETYIVILSAIAAEEEADIVEMDADRCIAKGPLNEMAQNIFAALDQVRLATPKRLFADLAEIKDMRPREITKELLSLKRHLEIIREKMSDGIFEITAEGRIVYANPSALSLVNIPEEKLLASKFVELFTGDDYQRIGGLLAAMNGKPEKITYESPLNLKGHEVTLNVIPVGGDMCSEIVILNDVTERKRSEKALRKAHDELEKRVRERTLKLAKMNDDLKREIEDRKQAEEALRMSEERYRAIVEDQTEMICRFLPDGTLSFVNEAYCRYFGKKPEDLIGHSFMPLISEEDREAVERKIASFSRENPVATYEHRVIAPDGEIRWHQRTDRGILDGKGHIIEFQSVRRDITQLKQVEDQIKSSLEEKEVLLREIHHRVKNNLQLISSLLDLSCMRTTNQETVYFCKDMSAKINAMSLIHAQLYRSERLDLIDMGRHIKDLVVSLSRLYAGKEASISPIIEPSNVYLSVTQAIPCALALNELISNAFKHAFKEGKAGTIEVFLSQPSDDTVSVKVKDNGIGIPEEFDIDKIDTLGLRLVRNLVLKQLGGKLKIERNNGTEIFIEFKILKEQPRHA